ncbi:molybdopterin dehydrogenase [Salipiger aestuarii]|uniref:Xanthine dehydrogenase YagS FAD-binding subunit n=1 Tax=Salipiger aestuarii TaxID=568098 RepID=A0A327XVK3_9RHOB|nr:xanthine dehydrogenase family protein subunit M [Salipiger aestuarii]EIE51266.1 molybdopterin dehydrogenase FAD-binding protein [Citreicella sp. 357]KAA8605353.1 molybdopterin dehydrogenase [Salipiger aestuarii]KAB2538806.1 molybdopterin dehydrogenase [Salipiger aestuarii]RAK12352.1 xanthine dehydrogenase YagS FAD-binding subunit [Salipiger aestuarii]
MNLFDYIRPATLPEAIAAGARPGASYLAGGTALLDLMKIGVAHPGQVVDISRLPGLDRIERLDDGAIRIGALVRNADLARDPGFAAACPAVAEALLSGASAQVRNAATLAGNLMQHTRCAYFQDPHSACNRRNAGAGCDAIGGETRGHAVLGWSDACIATHPSDFAVPLVALDAVVEIAGPDGPRDMPLADFYALPDATTPGGVTLAPGELITALRLPPEAAGFAANARYVKLRERTSFAFALVSAAAMLRIEDDRIAAARVALGGVAARPWRSSAAEAALIGATPGTDIFETAADLMVKGAAASGDNGFKIALARRITTRALTLAAAGTPARMPALPASVFAPVTGTASHA